MSDTVNLVPTGFLGFTTELNVPGLYPQAVMYALFDSDPRADLPRRMEHLGSLYAKAHHGVSRAIQLQVAWDGLFDGVKGSQVYLVVPRDSPRETTDPETGDVTSQATHTVVGFSGNTSTGTLKKWLVTRSCVHRDRPMAWCIPVDITPGSLQTVRLTAQNALDLETVY